MQSNLTKFDWLILVGMLSVAISGAFFLGRVSFAKDFHDNSCKISTTEFAYYVYPCSEFMKLK